MAPAKEPGGRKRAAARKRKIRETVWRNREEKKNLKTREQAAILLASWSRQGIVRK